MEARELRTGNLIIREGELIEVTGWNISELESGNTDFEPIPLTEEWLVKLGLLKQSDNLYFNYEVGLQSMNWQNENPFIKIDFHTQLGWCLWKNSAICKSNIQYIHQLQNLYFALTGQELTINDNH